MLTMELESAWIPSRYVTPFPPRVKVTTRLCQLPSLIVSFAPLTSTLLVRSLMDHCHPPGVPDGPYGVEKVNPKLLAVFVALSKNGKSPVVEPTCRRTPDPT